MSAWTAIVAEKIRKQRELLLECEKTEEADLLAEYLEEMEFGDATNREGHAAKVYFNALFGKSFSRSASHAINAALNYGYGILLSAVNREIAASGYLNRLGLHHANQFNPFNLGCDLVEPFRILVDRLVKKGEFSAFETKEKRVVLAVLQQTVYVGGQERVLPDAIGVYVRSVFDSIAANDPSRIQFYLI